MMVPPRSNYLDYGPFPAKAIACWFHTSPKKVQDIVKIHRTLSGTTGQRQRKFGENSENPHRKLLLEHDLFQPLPIFCDVQVRAMLSEIIELITKVQQEEVGNWNQPLPASQARLL